MYSESISKEAQNYMHPAHPDDKQISMLPTDKEMHAAGGIVYSQRWEDMSQYPPMEKEVRRVGRNLGIENNSELTEKNKGGCMNAVKRLHLHGKSLQIIKTIKAEEPFAGKLFYSSSGCLNPQCEDLKESLKRQTQLSLTSSGYSSSASHFSSKYTDDYARNAARLPKETSVMNVVSLQQCPHAVSSESIPKPQVDVAGSSKEVREISIIVLFFIKKILIVSI